jgi:hypothetical protein
MLQVHGQEVDGEQDNMAEEEESGREKEGRLRERPVQYNQRIY